MKYSSKNKMEGWPRSSMEMLFPGMHRVLGSTLAHEEISKTGGTTRN